MSSKVVRPRSCIDESFDVSDHRGALVVTPGSTYADETRGVKALGAAAGFASHTLSLVLAVLK